MQHGTPPQQEGISRSWPLNLALTPSLTTPGRARSGRTGYRKDKTRMDWNPVLPPISIPRCPASGPRIGPSSTAKFTMRWEQVVGFRLKGFLAVNKLKSALFQGNQAWHSENHLKFGPSLNNCISHSLTDWSIDEKPANHFCWTRKL